MKVFNALGNIFYLKDNKDKGLPCISLSYPKEGLAMAKFGFSERRNWGRTEAEKKDGKNKLDFWTCTAFGKTAEFLAQNFSEGSPVVLDGEIYHSKTEDGKSYVNFTVTAVEFVPKDYSQTQGGQQAQPQAAPAPQQYQQAPQGAQYQNPHYGQPQQQAAPQQYQQAPQQVQVQQAPPAPQPQAAPAPQVQPQQAPQGDPGFGAFTGFEPPQGVGSNGF